VEDIYFLKGFLRKGGPVLVFKGRLMGERPLEDFNAEYYVLML